MNDFYKRKKDELQLLSSISRVPFTYVEDVFGIFEEKRKLLKALKINNFNNFPLTNFNYDYKIKNNDISFEYEYQRFDSLLTYNDFVKKIYHINADSSKVIFTNSGMASIFSVLYTLKEIVNYQIIHQKGIYYETQQILNYKNFQAVHRKHFKKVLYIDDVSKDFVYEQNINFSSYYLVIIDSTYYLGYELKDLIEKILSCDTPCILVRSHTKLDMLGLEYSQLGSIVYLITERVGKKKSNIMNKMMNLNYQVLANAGLLCFDNNIFPYLLNDEVLKLNIERVNSIRGNNLSFYNLLKDKIEITIPVHNLFVLLQVSKVNSIEILRSKVDSFIQKNKSLVPIARSQSFAFDYVAFDSYINIHGNRPVIRIALGDIPDSYVEILAKLILDFIKEIF